MRLSVWLALFAFMNMLFVSSVGQARVNIVCPTFGGFCECAWHVRDCPQTCHLQPRLECGPTL